MYRYFLVFMYPPTGWGWSHLPDRKNYIDRSRKSESYVITGYRNDTENKFTLMDYFYTSLVAFLLSIMVSDSTFCLQSIDCMI